MTPQDSQSELEQNIFELVANTGREFMKTKVLKDWKLAKDIMPLIEAYVTTRVKEELQELVHGRDTYVSSGLIKERIAYLTTAPNSKGDK